MVLFCPSQTKFSLSIMGSDAWEMQEEASAPKLVGNVNLHVPMRQTILAVGLQEQQDSVGEHHL